MSLSHAISLAKLQEDKANDMISQFQNRRNPTPPTPSPLSRTPFRPNPNANSPTAPQTPPQTTTPIKRLTPQELQNRREKGMYYYCDEKYAPGHRCKRSFHIMIAEPEPEPNPEDQLSLAMLDSGSSSQTLPEPDQELNSAEISLHALLGHTIPETLKVQGQLKHNPVVILIDSGCTHNFIQDRVAKQLNLPLHQSQSFQVLVGNGEELICDSICHQMALSVGSHIFSVDLFVLPLSGVDIVLGVKWLKTLGPVLTNYEQLTMQFIKDGTKVLLLGEPKASPTESSVHQLKRLVATHSVDTYYHIQLIPSEPPSPTQPVFNPKLQNLLQQCQHLFSTPPNLPPPRPTDHRISLSNGSNPVNVRPYRYPQFQKREIENQIKTMLDQGIIRPSCSDFSSLILLVRKRDDFWRFCVDYRALNAITNKDRFPIPAIEELLDELYGTKWFSKLDLRAGYHQIRMSPSYIEKITFRTHLGHYEFLVMPFGLCNAPSTFQATMNIIFQPFLRRFVIVFFDDILIYSRTFAEHIDNLQSVFGCLESHQFFLQLPKCTFAQPSIACLGHIVTTNGVRPDPKKIVAMTNWPRPKNIKQLRGFLGLTGFYRKFIHHYASIAHALTKLLKKDSLLWTEEAELAFANLKHAMTKAPVLALPNFDEDFMIDTDASGLGMGAILSQNRHPITFFSKKFCPKFLSTSTYVRELCAITSAVKKWRTYLLGHKFIIHTNQRSLRELMTQVIQTPEQQFYLAKLLGFHYDIIYKSGYQNRVANGLS